jgi:formate dehydrogenase alpha subunit
VKNAIKPISNVTKMLIMESRKTICPYCGVGCGMMVSISDDKPVKVSGLKDHPVSHGHLCAKGLTALEILGSKERLTHPLRRKPDGSFEKISWSTALSEIALKLKDILRKDGPDAIGFNGGCLCTNEENYLIQKIARRLGTNNIESCARLCHQPSVYALKKSVGFGAASATMSSMKDSRLLMFVGSSLADSHPVLTQYVNEAKKKGAKVIDIDPRGPSFAKFADLHLKVAPSTDIALLNAMANVIISEGLEDKEFIKTRTHGYEEFVKNVEKYTPEKVERITEIDPLLVKEAARLYAKSGASLILVGIGITEQAQGTDSVSAVINLALLTGNYGRYGTGVCPLRGQANVQGAGDMGASAEFLPGGLVLDETNTKSLSQKWGFTVPSKKGKTTMEMIEAVIEGKMKAWYVMGFNPVNSLPNRTRTEKALSSLDLLVIQDIFMSATAKYAHYILPSATWLEREGTMTNMDRLVQWRDTIQEPIGEARPDWKILVDLSKEMGFSEFNYSSAKDILKEISNVVGTYAGIDFDLLSRTNEVRYPLVQGKSTDILFIEKFNTPDGKAKFIPVEYLPIQLTSNEFPFVLTTGRVVTRYNTDIMTGKSSSLLVSGVDINYVEVHPDDAAKIGLKDLDDVKVTSRFGKAVLKVKIVTSIKKGMLFAPMHGGLVNYLTGGCLDQSSLTPCYKWTAVNLEKV